MASITVTTVTECNTTLSKDDHNLAFCFVVLCLCYCLLLQVNKIEINYAKTAKKMDMKRLKNSMWTLLTESPEKPTEVNYTDRIAT